MKHRADRPVLGKEIFMKNAIRRACVLFAAGVLLTAAVAFREYRSDTIRQGYILREECGGAAAEVPATVRSGEGSRTVVIPVAPRLMTGTEAEALLDKTEKELSELIFRGHNPDRIDYSLTLPDVLENGLVQAVWSSDSPEILRWDGSLGEKIPPGGSPVTLTGILRAQDRSRTITYHLTVFPETFSGDERFSRAVLDAVLEKEDRTKDRILLPGSIDGMPVRWSGAFSGTPFAILFLSAAIAVLSVFAEKGKAEEAVKKKEEAMMLDYPSVTGKLVLLLHAGLSVRSAIRKIALDYTGAREDGHAVRPGYEEFVTMYSDMNRGLTEMEAYRALGKRTGLPAYRTLSTLLTQNLAKGSRTLLAVLDKEAGNAWEDRRKRARIRGENASLRLLAPMMILLGIVLVLMLVPAFMTLY